MRRARGPWWIVIVEHDEHRFHVEGPIYDDRWHGERVVALQKSGRDINCHTIEWSKTTKERIARHYLDQGFREGEMP